MIKTYCDNLLANGFQLKSLNNVSSGLVWHLAFLYYLNNPLVSVEEMKLEANFGYRAALRSHFCPSDKDVLSIVFDLCLISLSFFLQTQKKYQGPACEFLTRPLNVA